MARYAIIHIDDNDAVTTLAPGSTEQDAITQASNLAKDNVGKRYAVVTGTKMYKVDFANIPVDEINV